MSGDDDEGVFDPTLMVGLGGSGIRALRTILLYGQERANGGKQFDPPLAAMLQKKKIIALGIDTDADEFRADVRVQRAAYPQSFQARFDSRQLQDTYPEIPYQIRVKREAMNNAVQGARGKARLDRSQDGGASAEDQKLSAERVKSYLPIREGQYDNLLPSNNRISDGAGQLRALGRIGFLAGLYEISPQIAAIKNLLGDPNRVTPVCIFSSLAGGTGGGMVLDIAALIQKKFDHRCAIQGFFLLPEVFNNVGDAERIWANAYAALKELAVVAAPNPPEPIHYDFSTAQSAENLVLQSGDAPLFDDIYLFNEASMRVDWHPDPELASRAYLEAASRHMADTALALCRKDIFGTEKSRQNVTGAESAASRTARRVFHGAAAAHLLTLPGTRTANILLHETARKLVSITELEMQGGPTLPDTYLTLEGVTAKLLENRTENGETLRLPKLIHRKQTRSEMIREDTNLKGELKKQQGKFKQSEYQTLMAERAPAGVIDAFREVLRNIDDADEKLDSRFSEETPLTIRTRLSALLAAQIRPGLKELETGLDDALKSMRTSGRPLPWAQRQKLAHLQTALKTEASNLRNQRLMEHDRIEFKCPQAFFTLRSALGAYPEAMQAERTEWIEKYSPGRIADLSITLLEKLWSRVDEVMRQTLSTDAEAVTEEVSAAEKQRVVIIACLADQMTDLTDKISDVLKRSDANEQRLRGVLTNVSENLQRHMLADVRSDPDRDAFGQLMEPMFDLFDRLTPKQTSTPEERRETESFRRHLDEDWSSWLSKRNRDEAIRQMAIGIFSTIAQKFINVADDDENRSNILFKSVHDFIWDHWTEPAGTGIKRGAARSDRETGLLLTEMESRMDAAREFAIDLVEFLMDRPEFELARLGGSRKIRALANHARISAFAPGRAIGEIQAHYATVSLPLLNDRVGENLKTPTGQILSEIRRALDVEPKKSDTRSEMPMLLHESRHHAAYELRGIDRYRSHYAALTEDEVKLYHTIPGAETYPELVSRIAIADKSTDAFNWTCDRHGDDIVIESEHEQACTRCVREYERGTRRYQDISRQSSAGRLQLPGVEVEARQDGRTDVPIGMMQWFWDGIPNAQRNPQSPFRKALRDAGFNEPLDNGWHAKGKPRHFAFPAVSAGKKDPWQWVARSTNDHRRFVRMDEPDTHLHECHHCGFPIDISDASGTSTKHTCPRCRRSVQQCFYCTDNDGHLFQPLAEAAHGPSRCPRCTNMMDGPTYDQQ